MGGTVSQNESPPPSPQTTTSAPKKREETSSISKVIKAAADSSSNINDHLKINNQNGRVGDSVPLQLQSIDKKKIEEKKEKEPKLPSPSPAPQLQSNDKKKKIEEEKKEPNKMPEHFISNKRVPHNYLAIIKNADEESLNNNKSKGGGNHDVHSPVFLNKKTKKYWVDNYGHGCFMLLARDLSITWAEDKRYWHWPNMKDSTSDDVLIDVAELLNVCWLEVYGKLNTSDLSPQITYEVVFMVMLKDPAYGWEVPVNLRLELPDGTKQEHKENMQSKPRGQWIELHVGEFQVPLSAAGDIQISMFEYEGGKWKRGLVIKGIIVRPKVR